MMNRFVIILALVIKYAVNLLFKNGLHIKNFIPFDIDFGVVRLSLHEEYLTFQSTPNFKTKSTAESFKKWLNSASENLSHQPILSILKKNFNNVVKNHIGKSGITQILKMFGAGYDKEGHEMLNGIYQSMAQKSESKVQDL